MVVVMRPKPDERICDTASGTGGFFLATRDDVSRNYQFDEKQKKLLKFNMFKGKDIVDGVVGLCVMNLHKDKVERSTTSSTLPV
jgi:type I restriction enzyme M protein